MQVTLRATSQFLCTSGDLYAIIGFDDRQIGIYKFRICSNGRSSMFFVRVLRKVVASIAKIHPKLPAILEIDLQNLQGKGSGATSIELEAKIALSFIARSGIQNPVVLDIGANVGAYSEAILRNAPQSNVYAFEPSSFVRSKLVERFNGNSSVTIVPLALGNRTATETLWSDSPESGLASLTKRRLDHFGIAFNQSESVELTTLDSWSNTANVFPDLIKMDVEGHELDVLLGGLKTLAMARVVQFEFGGCNIDTKTFFQDFWYLLTRHGFAIYRISARGPIHISRYSEVDECFRTTNFLGVRA